MVKPLCPLPPSIPGFRSGVGASPMELRNLVPCRALVLSSYWDNFRRSSWYSRIISVHRAGTGWYHKDPSDFVNAHRGLSSLDLILILC